MSVLPKKILVVRNDKIGDFALSLPSFAYLKSILPDTRLYALIPEYTKDLAELCPYIDDIIMPSDTRKMVNGALDMLENKSVARPWRKYSNINL